MVAAQHASQRTVPGLNGSAARLSTPPHSAHEVRGPVGLGEGAGAGGGVGGGNREGGRGAGGEMGVVLSSFAAPEEELEERLEEEAGVVPLPFPTLGEGLEEGLEGEGLEEGLEEWKGVCGEGDRALGATLVFFFFLLRLVFLFVFSAGAV